MKRKVVITGMGAVTPVGIGTDAYWEALLAGKSGIKPITSFDASVLPSRIAGEITDFNPELYISKKEVKRMDRITQLTLAACQMAVADAGLNLETEDRSRIGVYIGTGVGGIQTMNEQTGVLNSKGANRVSPFTVPMMIANMPAGQISITYGLEGPSLTVVTACASGSNSIGEASRMIERGDVDVMFAGGSEAAIEILAFSGFCAMKAMSTRNEFPEKASSPFDAKRDGFVMGEGSGMVILESEEHALARGARIYAELAGYASSSDAFHITQPAPGGRGAQLAMRNSLKDAGLATDEVDYINAHGTATQINDRVETEAIKAVFGDYSKKLAVSSTKSMTGHLLGAAGAIELIAIAKAVQTDMIPPTINYEDPDEGLDLDYVPNQKRAKIVRVALSNTFGFGGHNATLVVKKYQ